MTETAKTDQQKKDAPGPRQAVDGAQTPPGVSATHTSPKPEVKSEGGAGVGGAKEAKHEGEEPKDVEKDTKLEPAKPKGAQVEAAPTATKLQKNSRYRISREDAEKMGRTALTAVALDRGYKLPPGGRRIATEAFLKEQEADDTLVDAPKPEESPKAKKEPAKK